MSEYKKVSFLDDFELPSVSHDIVKQQLSKIGKLRSAKKRNPVENMPLSDRLNYIYSEVDKVLGRYKNFVKVIRDEKEFDDYIDFAINKGVLSLDTETNNSLDPLTCKLMGLCLYIPNTKPVYVPVSHTKSNTDTPLENQVSIECIAKAFKKLSNSDIKIIYHNGKFDIRVCYNVTGVYLPIWWDTMIAAQLLNENETAKLKYQYKIHVDPTVGTYNIEKLFSGLPYAWVDPDVFALYSAIDAYDTYELQQEQQEIMFKEDMKNLYRLFREIEVPIVSVVSRMEDSGISVDLKFIEKLDSLYRESKEDCAKRLNDILAPYKHQIDYYVKEGKLDFPVNYDSPAQLNIVLYDILRVPSAEDKRSTDKETLERLNIPFTRVLLEYRHFAKMINGFTESWTTFISPKDGKIHASFNQMGKEENNVVTGRFSSSDPNMQQIPSHEGILRMAFKASTDYEYVNAENNTIELKDYQEVETYDHFGKIVWKNAKEIKVGNILYIYSSETNNSTTRTVLSVEHIGNKVILKYS